MVLTEIYFSSDRSMEIGFRKDRPNPFQATTISSPSSRVKPSPKLNASAPSYNTPMYRTFKRWRYIFNTLTVVSLVLMLGTVGLWVDSIFAKANL